MKSIEVQLNDALALLKGKDAEIAKLKTVIHTQQITLARLERDGVLLASGLSEDSIARLNAAFATSTNNSGLKQAIHVESRGAR
jgi:hypothetical protein